MTLLLDDESTGLLSWPCPWSMSQWYSCDLHWQGNYLPARDTDAGCWIAYSAFFSCFNFFAYKNRGGSYSAHILHICCIWLILKQGGFICKRGVAYANGDFIFCIFNICFIFDIFSVLHIFAIFNIFYIFCISRIFFNPFWQMVCKGFELSDEDEDQGQTYMSRQWLSRSPHVGARAATSSSCGIIHQLEGTVRRQCRFYCIYTLN